MKKISAFLISVLLFFPVFSQEVDETAQVNQSDSVHNTVLDNSEMQEAESQLTEEEKLNTEKQTDVEQNEESQAESQNESEEVKKAESGFAEVPPPKRPKPIDSQKAEKAREKDETENDEENFKNTIKYGIPSEISELVEKLIKNDDPRFTEELYDVFQETKNVTIQLQILKYFTKQEDPCLEDFAVELINDPYDAKKELVKSCFEYISSVKTVQAIPAVLTLIETENEDYFNDAISAIGEIGGSSEAVFLVELLDRDDLSDAQRQTLMRTCGKMHALETWDKITAILEDEDENTYVRMYAAEAIGLMQKEESVSVLIETFSETDPNLRQYVIKGLSNFPENEDAKNTIIQGIRDEHWRVRQESIKACKEMENVDAVPFLIYRIKNDSEKIIKEESIKTVAFLNTNEGNDFLISQLQDKKVGDGTKKKIIECLLKENHAGQKEILALAEECIKDDKKKDLRYAIGKELAKYENPDFENICLLYLDSKDTTTIGLGLDIYKTNKFSSAQEKMRSLYSEKKTNSSIKSRIQKMLNIEDKDDEKAKETK